MSAFSRITALIVSIFFCGFLFYEYITIGNGLLSFIMFIALLVFSAFAILIPTKTKIRYVHKYFTSFLIWLFSMGATMAIVFTYEKVRNLSPILFSTTYYYDAGVDIDFRKNRTFRAVNLDMVGGSVTYGKYELQDSLIILSNKIQFGNANMRDTLIAKSDGVYFSLEKPWKITEGIMWYKYLPKTTLPIWNKTNHSIDSLCLKELFSEGMENYQSLAPSQKVEYVFDMKNEEVDGDYFLRFNRLSQPSEKKEFWDITNGYPLETVQSIHIYKDQIVLELIFGKRIMKEPHGK